MNFSQAQLEQILAEPGYEGVTTFVETGTYKGDTTLVAARSGRFTEIHTIELSAQLYLAARARFRNTEVRLYHGRSSDILGQLSAAILQPALFYLDAHWFSAYYGALPAVSTLEPFPLWHELELLRSRAQPDIVVVDDVHTFGRRDDWTDLEWSKVSVSSLEAAFSPRWESSRVIGDQFVFYCRNAARS